MSKRTFSEFWGSLTTMQRTQLAKDAKTSYSYLSAIANGRKRKNGTKYSAGIDLTGRLLDADNRITFKMMTSLEED